jgi:uncharacterized SAM-binding protein YcdF (DUF218 family)
MKELDAIHTLWNYMLLGQELKKADVILGLGNNDHRTAEYAAKLYKEGWAPIIVFSGSGTVHSNNPLWQRYKGTTEAEYFAKIAIEKGVPEKDILIENKSQNTGQNYEFTERRLKERNIDPKIVIVVQKPYMERRAYATSKVWWPNKEIISTSSKMSFEDYIQGDIPRKHVVSALVGDMQRIKEYPKKGFQIEQKIPDSVQEAFEYLVSLGYTKRMIKD